MNYSCIRKTLITALVMACIFAPGISNAALNTPGDAERTVTVKYSDLDLTRIDGVRELYQRLRTSARLVCGSREGRERIDSTLQREQCLDSALSEAVKNVNNIMLESLHTNGD